MLRQRSVWYFVEVYELQTELGVFEAMGVANFGTQCMCVFLAVHVHLCFFLQFCK